MGAICSTLTSSSESGKYKSITRLLIVPTKSEEAVNLAPRCRLLAKERQHARLTFARPFSRWAQAMFHPCANERAPSPSAGQRRNFSKFELHSPHPSNAGAPAKER